MAPRAVGVQLLAVAPSVSSARTRRTPFSSLFFSFVILQLITTSFFLPQQVTSLQVISSNGITQRKPHHAPTSSSSSSSSSSFSSTGSYGRLSSLENHPSIPLSLFSPSHYSSSPSNCADCPCLDLGSRDCLSRGNSTSQTCPKGSLPCDLESHGWQTRDGTVDPEAAMKHMGRRGMAQTVPDRMSPPMPFPSEGCALCGVMCDVCMRCVCDV